jgi:hypothetical protein
VADGVRIQPSGGQVQTSGLAIWPVKQGKLVEMWNDDNHLDVLVESGQLTPAG